MSPANTQPRRRGQRQASRSDARIVSALFLATGSLCLFDLYRMLTLFAGG
jgi:hypothetical protein